MGCPSVRADDPRALASGLSYEHVDKHCVTIYTTYVSVDLAHHEIFRAKVGNGGVIRVNLQLVQIKSNIMQSPVIELIDFQKITVY